MAFFSCLFPGWLCKMLRNARSQFQQNICWKNHLKTQNFQATPETKGKQYNYNKACLMFERYCIVLLCLCLTLWYNLKQGRESGIYHIQMFAVNDTRQIVQNKFNCKTVLSFAKIFIFFILVADDNIKTKLVRACFPPLVFLIEKSTVYY